MRRPWHIWSICGLCLAVLLTAMGWVSWTALRLDRAQQQAAQQAEVEERVRLALWRMDSTLAALVVEEGARPYYAYDAFHAAERAYTKVYTSIKQGEVVVPSPLLTYLPTNVLVHFQFTEDGRLTSPQAPLGNERVLAEASYTTKERIETALSRLIELQKILNQPIGREAQTPASSLMRSFSTARKPAAGSNRDLLVTTCAAVSANPVPVMDLAAISVQPQARQTPEQSQMLRNSAEFNARANAFSQQQAAINEPAVQNGNYLAPASLNLSEGPFQAVWLGPALVLARRVAVNGQVRIQGCWLDWANLRSSLLAGVKDLFPAATLEAILDPAAAKKDTRRLAALPARLAIGPVVVAPLPFWSPIRFSLAVAWGCVLLAALAVVALLNGAVSLSERRGAFVSAVTHELRTPLTTFKMYSEMLAEGMVPEESRRQQYLRTLCSEANRLSHLVENVLAYARLERGSARSRVEQLSLGALLGRVRPRLDQRAEQAGLTLVVDAGPDALKTMVHVDVSAVEQILFNLVDNASKYANSGAGEKVIHVEAWPDSRFAMLRVRDHGQGISAQGARRLFRPFSKSAHEAAHTAPGVGLGLALCRRLSRSMGGDLRFDSLVKDGAAFILSLPVCQSGGPAPEAARLG